MYSDKSSRYLSEFEELKPIPPETYKSILNQTEYDSILRIADGLENYKWSHVNSTFVGGGVAEMLKSVVPIARGLNIDCEWFCLEGNDEFFSITKRFHNILQGVPQEFTLKELLETYIEVNKNNYRNYSIPSDFTIVHDPQPCAASVHGTITAKKLWRCQIDTSNADSKRWNYLLPFINNYDGAVFSHTDFVKPGIRVPVYQLTPAIDPLTLKNRQRTSKESKHKIQDLFKKHNIDPERPMVLAVSRYDVHKNQATIINAFKKLKSDPVFSKYKPQLIIVGNLADDDPEGEEMYNNILNIIDGDPDIYALLNIPDNDENVGALMKLAEVFIHVSTKDGFGLVVTEAMWQGTPVIGSKVGGIQLQVINGRTGYLVEPHEEDKIATYIKHFLEDPDIRTKMGIYAQEHVRDNFLMPTLVKRYLKLMKFYLGLDTASFNLL